MGLQHLSGQLSGAMSQQAREVMQRIEALARITDEPGRLTRTFCSPAMREANALVGRWMRSAGMTTREDAVGNLIGSHTSSNPSGKILLMGSHLDTVRNAGKFDGPLGVLLAIGCVQMLKREKYALPFGIDVVGFADEEGVRYQTTYLGSRAMAGTLRKSDLARKDADGITMENAILKATDSTAVGKGGDLAAAIRRARLNPGRVLGYFEAHIEQGPVLEKKNLPVGVVTAISGQSRLSLKFIGVAGHAGTTPMNLRRDALCAASEFVCAVESYARQQSDLVATVGQIKVEPGVSNVIPGVAELTLDIRHQSDAVREAATAKLRSLAKAIARQRGAELSTELVQATNSVPCSPCLQQLLTRAIKMHQKRSVALPSGAGHDAAVLGRVVPATMLFVRCKAGVSHHPDESVSVADIEVALAVMADFVRLLAEEYSSHRFSMKKS
jgi:allantoate deiminase